MTEHTFLKIREETWLKLTVLFWIVFFSAQFLFAGLAAFAVNFNDVSIESFARNRFYLNLESYMLDVMCIFIIPATVCLTVSSVLNRTKRASLS